MKEQSCPFVLHYTPSDEVKNLFSDEYTDFFAHQLMSIPEGTTLYHVYSIANPKAEKEHIGEIVLNSKLTTSSFGDNYLFFKHQDEAEDLKIHPEWDQHTPTVKCPFAKLREMKDKALGMLNLGL